MYISNLFIFIYIFFWRFLSIDVLGGAIIVLTATSLFDFPFAALGWQLIEGMRSARNCL